MVFLAALAFAAAKPAAKPQVIVAPAAEVIASPYVVSSSSQYIARNFNGLSAAYVAEAPVVSPYAYTYPSVYHSGAYVF
jgi:hypothetical protein